MKGLKQVLLRVAQIVGSASFIVIAGCASNPNLPGNIDFAALKGTISAEKLMVVDCLLPPQIRKIGSQMTYLAARQPAKLAALDCEIRGGEYVAYDRVDYRTSLMVWLEQAKAGDPEAQTYVGEIYEKGLGLPSDYRTAFVWYKKAAEQGFSRAQINLGYLYEKGLGVPRDSVMALNLYRRASGVSDDIDYSSSLQDRAGVMAEERMAPLREQLVASASRISQLQSSLFTAQDQLKNSRRALQGEQSRVRNLQEEIRRERARGIDTSVLEQRYQAQIAQLRSQQANVVALQSKVSMAQGALSKPVIEITEPAMLQTRSGEPVMQVRSGGSAQIIKGKINAAAGLRSALINGKPIFTDSEGFFNSAISIAQSEQVVTIEAIDQKNQTSRFVFKVIPGQVTAMTSQDDFVGVRASGNVKMGKYYALVIGNNSYQNYPRLETAAKDASRVASVLRSRYGFKTTLVKNADRYTMLSSINAIKAKLKEKDNLLIYYAGHGEIDQRTQQGYWLPVDAEPGNTANWIPNSAISDLLNTISAKHILVVADSCYSGSMSGTSIARLNIKMDESRMERWLKIMAKTKSRTVLTSGGLGPVLDSGGGEHSVFAQAFINQLESNQGILDAYRLYTRLSRTVKNRAAAVGFNQIPTYAPIRHAGHGGGEFVLLPG